MKFYHLSLLFLLLGSPGVAGNGQFATTADTITEALTIRNQPTPFKTRGLVIQKPVQTRSIKIVKRESDGQVVTFDRTIDSNEEKYKVDLSIHFAHDSATISPESLPLLDELGKALTGVALQNVPIIIKGHTDSDGEDSYNLDLSLRRAFAVKSYLENNFILTNHIEVYGYGETTPLVANNSQENKKLNRRVEIARNGEF